MKVINIQLLVLVAVEKLITNEQVKLSSIQNGLDAEDAMVN